MIKKCILFTATMFVLFTSCQKQAKKEDNSKGSVAVLGVKNAKNTIKFEGIYKGVLPCADCEGLEMVISLNENATYAIQSRYLGKGDKIFEQHGTFIWNKEGSVVTFENIENAPNQYAVGKNTLTQLDMEGKKITGNLARNYILTKQADLIETAKSPEIAKPIVNLNNKMEAQTIIKKVNPAVGKFTLAETQWRLIELYGKHIKQKGSKKFILKLNSKDGKFSAYMGCNTFSGNYFMKTSATVSFSNTIATMMICDHMDLERAFSKMLGSGSVAYYVIQENVLQLKNEEKQTLAKFEAAN
ncbi:copper resistance protein NlpE N-terminal domain-containing protein [Flavobacterium sp. XGLA_31]|uniref:copper resistance protein NlpE N-terminal domain-containing protein n=1 Tax=Flavobacterium sp. XGLA_31 TaxID=3447666 RepID=UPI003F2BE7CA